MIFDKLFRKDPKRDAVIRLGRVTKKIKDIDDIASVRVHDTDNCRIIYIKRKSNDKLYMVYDNPDWIGYGFYINDYTIDPNDLEEWGNTDTNLRRYLNYAKSGWLANNSGLVQYERLDSDYQLFLDLDNDMVFYVDDYSKDYEIVATKADGRWIPLKENPSDYLRGGEFKLA